jgi:hypothetical protein
VTTLPDSPDEGALLLAKSLFKKRLNFIISRKVSILIKRENGYAK